MKTFVYIYVDADHNEVQVFDNLKMAKEHAKESWGEGQIWEKSDSHWHDEFSDYVSIYKREINHPYFPKMKKFSNPKI